MGSTRRAVIDVGTNSVKLLVAEVSGHEVQPLWEESQQTRLGRGFYETHRLHANAIAATAKAAAEFMATARAREAKSVRIVATSAAREAVNAAELTSALEAATGVKPEIISGDQEAELGFRGVRTDPQLAHEPLLLLDVGGGSTEIILGRGEHRDYQQSFALGTVRLLERTPHSDPPKPKELAACRSWLGEFLEQKVKPSLEPALRNGAGGSRPEQRVRLIGTGGTASILGCMEAQLEHFDRQKLEATRLSLERVRWHVERLWGLPLQARQNILGLPKNRADVILTGTAIYEAIMDQFGFAQLRITTRGLRFAAVMDS